MRSKAVAAPGDWQFARFPRYMPTVTLFTDEENGSIQAGSSFMFSYSSIAAAIVGVVALTIDLVGAAMSHGTPNVQLGTVFTIADLVGVLCGAIAHKSTAGKVGLHLSWVPLTVVVIVLVALNSELSVKILRSVGHVLFLIADGLVKVITELAG
ncbi:hypothetical protein AB0J83_27965 [Actinoplanes sp. NPDC049596]|uniref:hypothetical protein n=1 Tax=unclassified Actinoplanes TaxID=2626549 RepID=UPI00342BB648